MCICHTNARCPCYRNDAEYRAERARQAHASEIEHLVLALLHGERVGTPSIAHRFADLIRNDPRTNGGADVDDILVAGQRIFWWLHGSGDQHEAMLDERPALRLAA
ncbi:conserved hypothetical protein [Paraburkholderia sacchari]|uniref:hypothetical protein n=1 Tax=Paraburkholderia sacchari TaxID=159450 RepID=UPI0039A44EC0